VISVLTDNTIIMKLILQVAAGVVLGGVVLWLLRVILGFSLIAAVLDRFGEKQLSVTLPKFSPSQSTSSASGSGWVDQQPGLGNILPALPSAEPVVRNHRIDEQTAKYSAICHKIPEGLGTWTIARGMPRAEQRAESSSTALPTGLLQRGTIDSIGWVFIAAGDTEACTQAAA
jgi:hypothetical protein